MIRLNGQKNAINTQEKLVTTIRSIFKWPKGKRGKKDTPTQTPITAPSIISPSPRPPHLIVTKRPIMTKPPVEIEEFCELTGIPFQLLTDVQPINWTSPTRPVYFVSLCAPQARESALRWSGTVTIAADQNTMPRPIILEDDTGRISDALRILDVQSYQVLGHSTTHEDIDCRPWGLHDEGKRTYTLWLGSPKTKEKDQEK